MYPNRSLVILGKVGAVRTALFFLILASLAFLIFQYLVVHWDVRYSSDTALVGLMAKHIAESGERPIFVWGVGYQGMLIEGYLTALLFKIWGDTPVILSVVPVIVYCLAFGLWLFLSFRAFGRDVALLSGLLMTWTSSHLYLLVFRNIPNYPEALLVGCLIWYIYIKWFRALRLGQEPRFRRFSFCLGGLIGFGTYLFPISLYFALASAIHFFCFFLRGRKQAGIRLTFKSIVFPRAGRIVGLPSGLLAGLFLFGVGCLLLGFDSLSYGEKLIKWDPVANLFYAALGISLLAVGVHLKSFHWRRHFPSIAFFVFGFLVGNFPSLYYKFVLGGSSIKRMALSGTRKTVLGRIGYLIDTHRIFFNEASVGIWGDLAGGIILFGVCFAVFRLWRQVKNYVATGEGEWSFVNWGPLFFVPWVMVILFLTSRSTVDVYSGRYIAYLALVYGTFTAYTVVTLGREKGPIVRTTLIGLVGYLVVVSFFGNQRDLRSGDRSRFLSLQRTFEENHISVGYAEYWLAYAVSFLSHEKIILEPDQSNYNPHYGPLVRRESRVGYALPRDRELPSEQNEITLYGITYRIKERRVSEDRQSLLYVLQKE